MGGRGQDAERRAAYRQSDQAGPAASTQHPSPHCQNVQPVGLSNWTSRIGQSTFPVGARPVSGRSLKRESKKGSDSSNLKSECATLKAL